MKFPISQPINSGISTNAFLFTNEPATSDMSSAAVVFSPGRLEKEMIPECEIAHRSFGRTIHTN